MQRTSTSNVAFYKPVRLDRPAPGLQAVRCNYTLKCIFWDTLQGIIEIRQTEVYAQWFDGLRDRHASARFDVRIRRLSLGNSGAIKPVGEGVSELRLDYGSGYQVFFTQRGNTLIVLLAGGDKRTQNKNIKAALDLARDL